LVDRNDVSRAEWQLWGATFAILAALAGAIIYIVTGEGIPEIAGLPSRTILIIALASLVVAFATYAIDRERGFKRLNDHLIAEQLTHERLAARLASLAELARERDTSTALLEASADGMAVIDTTMTIIRFNPAMGLLTGIPSPEAVGASALDILPLADPSGAPLDDSSHPLSAVFADGVARVRNEMQLILQDGSVTWVSATFSPILEQGAPALVLIALRDISAQKESEMMQRDFVSMAAHELRSPLTAIKGFTRTLMTKFELLPPERRGHYLAVVNDQSNRLARLVDDLMQVSRIDAGSVRLDTDSVDLGDVVRSLAEQFGSKWAGRALDIEVDDDAPPALADPHKLEEILINLIDNAVKYSPASEPVHVSVRSCARGVEVSVRDHGGGIPPEDLDKLFGKFQRLSAKATDVPGTGLGLYIVKGLIEAHGGEIWVDSEVGEGTTFTFSMPAALMMSDVIEAGAAG
jgi:PAS domain S-box-containing protein